MPMRFLAASAPATRGAPPSWRSKPVSRRQQAGQALLETLVGASVMIPFVVLIVWLGKVQTMQQAAISGSRLLAFECSVRPEACAASANRPELADELRRRVFARADLGIFSADRMADEAPAAERNPLWTDHRNRALIERFADVGVRVDAERFDAGLSVSESRAGVIASNALEIVSDLAGPGRFGLEIRGGLVNARVQVNASRSAPADNFASQLASIPLALHAHTAVLTDAWNASGADTPGGRSVEARVSRGRQLNAWHEASIDARYLPVRGFLSLMELIGLEPTAEAFRYHSASVDVVPEDRIAVDPSAQPGNRTGGPRDPNAFRRSRNRAPVAAPVGLP